MVAEARRAGRPEAKQCGGHARPHQLLWMPWLKNPKIWGAQSIHLKLER
jgi:hypothetical protein